AVNIVDGGADQHHVGEVGVLENQGVEAVFQEPAVGEEQAFVNPEQQDMGIGLYLVAVDVAKMFRTRDLTHNGSVGTAGLVQVKGEGEADTRQNTDFNADQ